MAVLLSEGTIDYWWQANPGSWSGHPSSTFPTDPAACVRQYVGMPAGCPPNPGFSIDVDEFIADDCGLWKSPLTQGDDLTPDQAKQLADIHAAMFENVDNSGPSGLSGSGMPWAANETLMLARQIQDQIAKLGPVAPGSILSPADVKAVVDGVLAGMREHPSAPMV
jgi:hypothetical protein